MRKHIFVFYLLLITQLLHAQNVIDLTGEWNLQIDKENKGLTKNGTPVLLTTKSTCPVLCRKKLKGERPSLQTQWTGSLYDSSFYYNPELEMFRRTGNIKFPFFLTPERRYVGAAWYKREIHIPSSWKGKRVMLFLERPHIETTVWINNQRIGSQNSLSTPHEYDITTAVRPGTSTLTLRIDTTTVVPK